MRSASDSQEDDDLLSSSSGVDDKDGDWESSSRYSEYGDEEGESTRFGSDSESSDKRKSSSKQEKSGALGETIRAWRFTNDLMSLFNTECQGYRTQTFRI